MQPTDTSNPDYFHRVVDCQWACPAHTDVPEYIRLIALGQFSDAYIVNRESNVFPGILGRVCDRPCEPACRRGRVEDKPVAICRLKRVAADHKDSIVDRLPVVPAQNTTMPPRFTTRHDTGKVCSPGCSNTISTSRLPVTSQIALPNLRASFK